MSGQHLSYSQISMYLDCGRRWQGQYRQGLKSPIGEALVFGTIAHNAIESYIQDKNQDLLEMFNAAWEAEFDATAFKGVVWDETPSETKNAGIRLFTSADLHDLLDQINPKIINGEPAIERYVEWNVEGLPTIIGYIDCICDDGVPLDFKTASKMWSDDRPAHEIQPLFYLSALEQLGEHDHQFKFRHLVMTKAKTPRVTLFETQRSAGELLFMEDIVKRAWSGISSGVFIPNPSSMLCSPKFCGAWYECMGKFR